jgi:predicted nucleotidyltransferase
MSRTSRPYDLSLEADRRAVIASALGSQRASGLEPDAAALAELDAFVRGELSLDQVRSRANARLKAEALLDAEPRLRALIALCRSELGAEEVWLFGSRARGDHRPDSDWDLLAILPDDAPEEALDPVRVWEVRRRSGLHADLLVVTRSEFLDAQDSVTTLSAIVAREGVMLFPE